MKKSAPLALAGAAVAVALAWVLIAGEGSSSRTARHDAPTGVSKAGASDAGFVVHVDPSTGAFTASSPQAVRVDVDRVLQNALSTSSEGLVEVANPVPGGGVMVDLRGRFQNAMVATVDESGGLGATCVSTISEKTASDSTDSAEEGGGRR